MKIWSSLGKRVLVLSLLLFAYDAFAAVGVVQFAAGDVRIRDAAGVVRPVKKGDAINEGDAILSGAGASAQLKMSDNGILAIRPETELKIDEYKFSGKEDGKERAFLSLVKGGFRTITGVIGRTNKDNYKIGTTTATIGIRGTDHEPFVIPVLAAGAGKGIAPSGTYDKVNVGQAYIATPQGSVNINPNQVGFAAPNQTPRLLPATPEFFKATPPVRTAQQQKEAEKEKQAAQQKEQQKQAAGDKDQQTAQQKQQAAAQDKEQQTAQTKQAAATGQAAEGGGQAQTAQRGEGAATTAGAGTQTGGQTSQSQGTPATRAGDTPGTMVAAAPSEIRASSIVDPTSITSPTSATNAVVQTAPAAPATTTLTSTTTSVAPPAVVQEITGKSSGAGSDDTGLTLNLTDQTLKSSSGTPVPIDQGTFGIEAQNAADDSKTAATSAQVAADAAVSAQNSVSSTLSSLKALSPVNTGPASSAIGSATNAVNSAKSAVNNASSITPVDLSSATSAVNAANSAVTSAQSAVNALGAAPDTATIASAIAGASAQVSTAQNAITALPTAAVDLSAANTAVTTASPAVGSAQSAVNAAGALTAPNSTLAASNATISQSLTNTFVLQADSAHTAATRQFSDATYAGSADVSIQGTKSAVTTLNNTLQTTAGTASSQASVFGAAKSNAIAAMTQANVALTAASAAIAAAGTENANFTAIKGDAVAALTAASTDVGTASSALSATSGFNSNFAAAKSSGQSALTSASTDLSAATASLQAAQAANAALSTAIANAQAAISSATSTLASASDQLTVANNNNSVITTQRSSASGLTNDLAAAVSAAQSAFNSAQKAATDAQTAANDAKATQSAGDFTGAQKALDNALAELSTAKAQLTAAQTAQGQAVSKANSATANFNAAQNAISAATNAVNAAVLAASTAQNLASTATSQVSSASSLQAAASTGASNAVSSAGSAQSAAASAQSGASTASGFLSSAQSSAASANNAVASAQNNATTALSKANAAGTASTNAQLQADSALAQASLAQQQAATAQTQASFATSAQSAGTAAVDATTSALTSVQSLANNLANSPLLAQAQYTNPAVALSNFVHNVGSQTPFIGGTQNAVMDGGNAGQSNTSYVLDENLNLFEIRHTQYTRFGPTSTTQPPIANANVKFSGGTGSDTVSDPNGTYYMGRWQGGQITVTDNSGTVSPFTDVLGLASAHWIMGLATNNVQTLTGTANYSKSAATHPTDSSGNVGTLDTVTLAANFSSQTVDAFLGLSFSTRSFTASATNMPIKGQNFEASAPNGNPPTVICNGSGCGIDIAYSGSIGGAFIGAASGHLSTGAVSNTAGMAYTLFPITGGTEVSFADLIQGAVVLTTGSAPSVGTAAFSNASPVVDEVRWATTGVPFAIGNPTTTYVVSDKSTEKLINNPVGIPTTLSGATNNTNYLFDAAGNLVRVFNTPHVVFNHGNDVAGDSAQFSAPTPIAHAQISFGGANATAESYDLSLLGIRLGRWTGGAVNITDLQTGTSYMDNLGLSFTGSPARSVQWVVAQQPAMLAELSGVYQYTRVNDPTGGAPSFATRPTDSYGNIGTLERARLVADFTHMTVSAGVSVSIDSGPGGSFGNQQLQGRFTDAPIGTGGGFNVSASANENPPGTDNFHISCFGTGCAPDQSYGGRIRGGFSSATGGNTADGAYFRYTFNTTYGPGNITPSQSGRAIDDYIDGIVAFGQEPQIVPPSTTVTLPSGTSGNPPGDATIFYSYFFTDTSGGSPQTRNQAASIDARGNSGGAAGDYTVDGAGTLRSATSQFGHDESIAVTNGSGAATNVASNGIAYGYVMQPTVSGQDFNGTFTNRSVLDALHWIAGPSVYPWYISGVTQSPVTALGATSVAYANIGGVVTDQSGNPGTFSPTAVPTLSINFNSQTVSTQFSGSLPGGVAFSASANNVSLNQDGSFFASNGGGLHHSLTSSISGGTGSFGNIEGALMGPGLNGAGYVFSIASNGSSNRASGSLIFGNPTYFDGIATVPFKASPLAAYQLGIFATGMNPAGVVTRDGNPGTPLVSERDNYRVDIGVLAPDRTQFVNSSNASPVNPHGTLVKFDGTFPVVTNSCTVGTACNNVSEIAVRYATADAAGGGPTVTNLPALPPTAVALETHYDPTTGLRWGRWGGGAINVGDRASANQSGAVPVPGGTTNQIDLTNNNWHYIVSSAQSGPMVLPTSGTFAYNLLGGTNPTASGSAVPGVLNSASLVANFTTQTVNVGVNVTMPGNDNWSASANNVPILKGTGFEVSKSLADTNPALNITRNGVLNPANSAGRISGGFTGATGAGAAIGYALNHGGPTGTTVSGVAAFKRP